jgi:hypothetical protein
LPAKALTDRTKEKIVARIIVCLTLIAVLLGIVGLMRNEERGVSKYFLVPVRERIRLPGMVRKVCTKTAL